ncbi:MFS transporter, SP family, solute carrier family 2 (myo-inositol transporter), member 13 [Cryptococcus neoformans C23]|uniref:Myo-inositol transporter 2 n=1 Tax=Cryptococcus neoformans (strain H99 / ATCC 208821 / CBS 10515 / FGSC 9487) TaxID=235443 RepID=ITR2_CRYN9|nr:MFS transporter, SP family, solute carrier family 2 (myo-inositol transporter), member 13 [Cryptococcus neoformans var. grubii H99]J9VLA6.1 RecName: Full=Myo-inositol transporter 2 [Cryptococcus neoformans var. grubii H99]AUB25050.1 MFS transporter, SP family, solute carrier family 2 (myo-inositol transporter), member 13 [Cryptococcus neoformans var. grubii]OWZ31862.1 MFS transporter, SP family, solute carrier family 2 (myo-inositol transporter), member 13 [Cryptococcus neoformans var. grubii|eukprot:XP_012049154.1 MFS transporter, SP family, solute carrier family 2 (myo-inositol transporter), member 13 [Cryptococcus neoformans var. grubii H99]
MSSTLDTITPMPEGGNNQTFVNISKEDLKVETEHYENVAYIANAHDGLIDENLVRAENEDKVTPYFMFLISVAAIAGFLFGYDTGIVGAALPMVGTSLGHTLSATESEIITAGTTIGAIFGASILGTMADKLGRKWAMIISDFAFTAGAIIIAASYSVPQIIVGRLVLGVGVGGAAVIAPLYIAELAPTAVRGRCVGANAFCIPFGQVVASAIGAGFQAGVPYHIGWRVLFGLGVVPSVVQLCLMHFLPESPRVLVLRGKEQEARACLKKIYGNATDDIIDLKLRIVKQYVAATTTMQRDLSFTERAKKYWTHKPYRRAIISVSGVQAFGQLTGFNTLLYYSGTIFGLLGLKNGAAAGLIPSCLNALFVFIGMSIVDKVGRRKLMITFIPGMMIAFTWTIISFHFLTKPTGGLLLKDYQYSTPLVGSVLGSIVLFVIPFGLTYSHIIWYQSEFLPLEIRAAGSAISTTACWLANLVVSVAYLTQLEKLGATGTYGLYLGFITIGYIFVYFCYPETKGLSIDETAEIFIDGFGIEKAHQMLREKRAFAAELYAGRA